MTPDHVRFEQGRRRTVRYGKDTVRTRIYLSHSRARSFLKGSFARAASMTMTMTTLLWLLVLTIDIQSSKSYSEDNGGSVESVVAPLKGSEKDILFASERERILLVALETRHGAISLQRFSIRLDSCPCIPLRQ